MNNVARCFVDVAFGRSGANAWAWFHDNRLVGAGLLRPQKTWTPVQTGIATAWTARSHCPKADAGAIDAVEVFVEGPRHYGVIGSAPANDILNLAIVSGAVAASLQALVQPRCERIEIVTAADWKRTIKAEILIERGKNACSPAERKLAEASFVRDSPRARSHDHNGWDAITMGLVYHGRLPRMHWPEARRTA